MNRVTLTLTFLFSLMFSSPSYSEWTKGSEDGNGNTFYVDFERIRKVDGYVYFWLLQDSLKPKRHGILSGKMYNQGDCKLFRFKTLSFYFHKEPMGGGTGDVSEPIGINRNWKHPPPNTIDEFILKHVCLYVGE